MFDRIGAWTKTKHDIVQYYAEAYSKIMTHSRKRVPTFKHFYIDGFASAGMNLDKQSGRAIPGSALRVLDARPPFARYFLVERDAKRFASLRDLCSNRADVEAYCGDANVVLPSTIFPKIRHASYERAFCLLDPYNETNLRWETIMAAARTGATDVLIHFPIYSMNINVLRKEGPRETQRLDAYWGDDSWQTVAYEQDAQLDLFGSTHSSKVGNEKLVSAYRERLVTVGGFKATSKAIPMRNSKKNIVYYLVFATSNETAGARTINDVANHFIRQVEGSR